MTTNTLDALALLTELSETERVCGTEGECRGRDLFLRETRALGLAPRVETFPLQTSNSGTGRLCGPGGLDIEAAPYGSQEGLELEGELCFLENADALTFNPGAYRDRIVAFFQNDLPLADALRAQPVKAILRISAPYKTAFRAAHRQPDAEPLPLVPIACVTYEDGIQLREANGQPVRLVLEQDFYEGEGQNVVVDIPGTEPDDSLTLLVGHYDTVARSPGAADNGGGAINCLQAAAHFAAHPPRRDLRIIFFSGEELGLLGSFSYAREHAEELKRRARLVINVDLTGDPIGQNKLIVTGTHELRGYAGGVLREAGLLFGESLDIYSSDNMPFARYEIPALNVARVGGKALFHIHTDQDKAEHTDAYGLDQTAAAAIALLERFLNAKIYPTLPRIDKCLRDKIERYYWNLTRQKPELDWLPAWKR